MQGIPSLYVVNICHLPCIYSSNYTHTPLNDVAEGAEGAVSHEGGVASISVSALQKRKLLVVVVMGVTQTARKKREPNSVIVR